MRIRKFNGKSYHMLPDLVTSKRKANIICNLYRQRFQVGCRIIKSNGKYVIYTGKRFRRKDVSELRRYLKYKKLKKYPM